MDVTKQNPRFGLICAVLAQVLWGCFPIYVFLLRSIAPNDFVAHRAIWSFFLLASLVWISKWVHHAALPTRQEVTTAIYERSTLRLHAIAAFLILINWIAFVWAVMNDHAIDASMGYYICPLVVVLLGVVFLHERLNPLKWLAVVFAAFGVGYTAYSKDTAIWIPLAIACSFGLYGLVKKRARLSALAGLTLETGFLLVPALMFLGWQFWASGGVPVIRPWWVYVLLFGSGLTTIAPLAFYAAAVKHLPLSTVGFLQYIGPTIQFFAGVFVLGESLDLTRLVGFSFVWMGVVIFLVAMSRGFSSEKDLHLKPD